MSRPMMLTLVSSLIVKEESCWTVRVIPVADKKDMGSGTICKV